MDQRVDGATIEPTTGRNGMPTVEVKNDCLTMAQAIRTRAFYLVAATNTIWAMSGTGIVFYLFTLCDDRGFDSQVPAGLFKTFGLSMLTMQILGGVLADFLPLNRLMGIGAAFLSIGLALIRFGHSIVAFQAYAISFGAVQGTLVSVSAVLWVRYFGREHLGSIRGTTWSLYGCRESLRTVDHGSLSRSIR